MVKRANVKRSAGASATTAVVVADAEKPRQAEESKETLPQPSSKTAGPAKSGKKLKKKKLRAAAESAEPTAVGLTKKGAKRAAEVEAVSAKPRGGEASGQAAKRRKSNQVVDEAAGVQDGAGLANSSSTSGANNSAKVSAPSVECTVFVDGVPYTWTEDKIKEFFQGCGSILEVKAPKWQDSGRLRGYAHVTFSDKGAKKKALAMNNTAVGKKGRFLKIESAKESSGAQPLKAKELEGKRRLFVKNLPYDVTEAEVGNLFKAFGKVNEVRIPASFGRCKGFAYVEFAKCEYLKAAVQQQPAPEIRGRTLRLDADVGQGPKAGFHARPEAYESGFGPSQNKGKGGGKGRGAGGGKDGKGGGKGKGRGMGAKLSLF